MMSSPTEIAPTSSLSGLEKLEHALRAVLGEGFEYEIRALVEDNHWYTSDLSSAELFRLWVCENLDRRDDPQWIFQLLRAGERRLLCDKLNIERDRIIGKSPRELADIILISCDLPVTRLAGLQSTLEGWQELERLVENDEDEKAASISRQRAERLLRKILYFYCSSGYGEAFVDMLARPESLRVPGALSKIMEEEPEGLRTAKIAGLLPVDGWADLGFLALALRKYSVRLEGSTLRHLSGAPLMLFTTLEYDAFSKLGTALQAYAHDRPSKRDIRQQELGQALRGVTNAIQAMMSRRIVPDEVLVMAAGVTFLGNTFKGLRDSGDVRCLTAQMLPMLGKRVMVITTAECDYAMCYWVESPWPIDL